MAIREQYLSQLLDYLETTEKNSISLKDFDYRELGLIWQDIVENHLRHSFDSFCTRFLEVYNKNSFTTSLDITFSHFVNLPENRKKLLAEDHSYFVFDGYVRSNDQKYIIEMKLSHKNIGLKELKYMYYFPDAILIFIFFFPGRIQKPDEIMDYLKNKWEDEFNEQYHPEKTFNLSRNKIVLLGRKDIGIKKINKKQLHNYAIKSVINRLKILYLLCYSSQDWVILEDIRQVTNLHHARITNILKELLVNGLIEEEQETIIDSSNKVQNNITLYTFNTEFIKTERFSKFLKTCEKFIDLQSFQKSIDNLARSDRKIYTSSIRPNEHKILDYLLTFDEQFITVKDIQDNVEITSTSEINRCLKRMSRNHKILVEKRGYQVNLSNRASRTYKGTFYKIKREERDKLKKSRINKSENNHVGRYNKPKRVFSEHPFTLHELNVIFFLYHNGILSETNALTLTELKDNLKINHTTLFNIFKRLQKPVNGVNQPLVREKRVWVISQRNNRINLTKASVFYLNSETKDHVHSYINNMSKYLEHPSVLERYTLMLKKFPLTYNECLVIKKILKRRKEHTLNFLIDHLSLNKRIKSNKNMLRVVLNRLSDKKQMMKRGMKEPILIKKMRCANDIPSYSVNPFYLTKSDFRQTLEKIIQFKEQQERENFNYP